MNILSILIYAGLSNPINGGQNRFFNIVRQLARNGNKVVVLEPSDFFTVEDNDLAERIYLYNDIKLFGRNFAMFRDFNLDFAKKIMQILKKEKIDIIQISHPSGAPIIKLLTKFMGKEIPIVYDSHNVESIFAKEAFFENPEYSKIEILFQNFLLPFYINSLEKITCKHLFDYITAVSNYDKSLFMRLFNLNGEKIGIIPSGCNIIELEKYKNEEYVLKRNLSIENDKIIIFFHGSYSHTPNKEAIEIIKNDIAPYFQEKHNLLFLIGGSGVPKFESGNIKSIGFIDDLNKVLSIVDIAIVPLVKGAGTKLKIFDYMNAELPIVVTNKGIEGIGAKNYEEAIILKDVNHDFLRSIEYLVNNESERKRIGIKARRLAVEVYDWNKIGKKLNDTYKNVLGGFYENR